jgi:CRISPR-associated protein (Cas_Cmr5)
MSRGKPRPNRPGPRQPPPQRPAAATLAQPRIAVPATAAVPLAFIAANRQQDPPMAKPLQAADPKPGRRPLRTDQQRALAAYGWAAAASKENHLVEYQIAVQSFAAALLRSGFAAAVAVLERNKTRAGFERLLGNLSDWPLSGIGKITASEWPAKVRGLDSVTEYMLATRELILLLGWLRRACRALEPLPETDDA